MYLGKDKKIIETQTKIVVPFCEECGSQKIKAVYTCQNCKSHNIKFPKMLDNDERAFKKETKEINVYKYKCDICNREFEYNIANHPNYIFYEDQFYKGYNENVNTNFQIPDKDICDNCLDKIVMDLNKDLNEIVNLNFIKNKVETLKQSFNSCKESDNKDIIIKKYIFLTLACPTQLSIIDIYNNSYFFRYRNGKYQFYRTAFFIDNVDDFNICTMLELFKGEYKELNNNNYITYSTFKTILRTHGWNIKDA